jgi:hypothetical protein
VLAARSDGERLRSAADAPPGTGFHLDFADGRVEARAENIDFPGDRIAARRTTDIDSFDEEAA